MAGPASYHFEDGTYIVLSECPPHIHNVALSLVGIPYPGYDDEAHAFMDWYRRRRLQRKYVPTDDFRVLWMWFQYCRTQHQYRNPVQAKGIPL